MGAATRYTYDPQHNLAAIIQPNGGTWSFICDGLGRSLSVRDPTGAGTRYAYSPRGDILAEYAADGGVTRYAYDGEGHITQIVDAKGGVTQFIWGGFHKLAARRDANGHIARLAYSREGELLVVTNERGEVNRFGWDTAGRLVREETFDGRDRHCRYDLAGQNHTLAVTRGQLGEVTRTVLDGTDNLEHEADLMGREVARTLPRNGWLRTEYDALGRLARRRAGNASIEAKARAGEPDLLGTLPRGLTVDMAYRYGAPNDQTDCASILRTIRSPDECRSL